MGTNRASGSDAAGSAVTASDAADDVPSDAVDHDGGADTRLTTQVDAGTVELDARAEASTGSNAIMDAQPLPLDAGSNRGASPGETTGDAGDATVTPDAAASGEQLAESLVAKLRGCGIVGAGAHHVRPVLDGFDRCRAQCELDASCATLTSTRCGGQRDATLENCLTACTTAPRDDGYACGTRRIRKSWVCDGVQHCAGREDESSCTSTACVDGTEVSKPAPQCDGVKDCADGSDELECAPYCT